jgi:DNA-binding CsgD family transcriptional regulator
VILLDRLPERAALGQLLEAARGGRSDVLVLRGEAGVGKTALLENAIESAAGFRVARVAGVESEMELAFAALQQFCAPMLDKLEGLPHPQRDALGVAFGLTAGAAPDRFLVGLAALNLLSEAAEQQPLLCVIDDAQWLDRASAQALGFAARRLLAEPVALVFAAREPGEELRGLPELLVGGLSEGVARELLDLVIRGPLDQRVRDRIVAETRGNPLALLELPRGVTPADLAGGFGAPGAPGLAGRIEDSFRRRLEGLPAATQRLMLVAAAEPAGESALVWRAAQRLGVGAGALAPAADAGLLMIGERVVFRHPLVRSAAYRAASPPERRAAHAALAGATDSEADPDRRAWHRAQATLGPDEEVAAELERSAGRAQGRGGLAAAAAFLERSAALTLDPARRAERALAAAQARYQAGAFDAALGLLASAESGAPDPFRRARADLLRGQIAFDQRRGTDAARLLLSAARLLEPLDADLARETYLEALVAAMDAGDLGRPGGAREAAGAARAAPPGSVPPRAVDVVLDAFALRVTQGHAAAAPTLARALELLVTLDAGAVEARHWLWLAGGRAGGSLVAMELWDFESWHALAARQVQVARDIGALVQLQFGLNFLAEVHLLAGELSAAARLIDEERLIAEATGNPPVTYLAMLLAAWQGREQEASGLIEATAQMATERGTGRLAGVAACASAVLYNGLGRYDAARDAAREVFERDHLGFGPLVVAELAEAAARTGDVASVKAALDWLSERTQMTQTAWVLGIEARIRALLSDGQAADSCYRKSIERLGQTRIRAELGRSHLLYGEWLRRQRRQRDARDQLGRAYEIFDSAGAAAFAERTRIELRAAGGHARQPAVATPDTLTSQEALIARLAADGASNPEIAAQLFISRATVAYHLRKVFTKLDVSSRSRLAPVLPSRQGGAAGLTPR